MKYSSTKKKELEKLANSFWKDACLLKWGNKSIISGKPATVFHHFIPKSRSKLLKYDVNNGVPLTEHEHYLIHNSSDLKIISQMKNIIRKKRGQAWEKYIDEKSRDKSSSYYTIEFIEEQIRKLKECSSKEEQRSPKP